MGEWLAIIPAVFAVSDEPDTAAYVAAGKMVAPLEVERIYVVKVDDARVYEVGVYQVPR
jgi:hypothetical protein